MGHLVAAEPGRQHGGEAHHQLAQLLAAVGGGHHHVLHGDAAITGWIIQGTRTC